MSRNPKALAHGLGQVDTPAFRAWFGGSMVVDARGAPLVVYHGTFSDFHAFETNEMTTEGAAFFSASSAVASGFANAADWGQDPEDVQAQVMPVYLAIKNPMCVTQADVTADGDHSFDVMRSMVNEARAKGHDGLHISGYKEGGGVFDQWAAFSPTQIKSSIGNSGAFGINSPNILHSFAGPLSRTADKGALRQAQASLESGVDPEHVRQHLGWHQGLDGKMRFEITDDGARLKTKPGNYIDIQVNRNSAGVWGVIKLGDLLDHEPLFAAYPELADIEVTLKNYGGSGGHAREQGIVLHGAICARPVAKSCDGPFPISQEDADAINAQEGRLGDWRVVDPGRVVGTLLHEIQHVIQGYEGFSAGGNEKMAMTLNLPESVMRSIALNAVNKESNKKGHKLSEPQKLAIAQQVFLGMNADENKVLELQRETGLSEGEMSEFFWPDYFEIYHRLHGEIEARNVQARLHMTQSQRKQTPPGATADVPDQDAIVFGVVERDANDGHAESFFDGSCHGISRQRR